MTFLKNRPTQGHRWVSVREMSALSIGNYPQERNPCLGIDPAQPSTRRSRSGTPACGISPLLWGQPESLGSPSCSGNHSTINHSHAGTGLHHRLYRPSGKAGMDGSRIPFQHPVSSRSDDLSHRSAPASLAVRINGFSIDMERRRVQGVSHGWIRLPEVS